MRTSVETVKRRRKGHDSLLREAPTPGTRLRKLYDMFMARPLTPIHLDVIQTITGGNRNWGYARERLAGYELDIRKHSPKRYWLVATEERDYLGEAVNEGRAA